MFYSLSIRPFILGVVLIVGVLGLPKTLEAQNRDPPEAVKEVIDEISEVKLGVQVTSGVQYRTWTIIPLQTQTFRYLSRPLSGDLSFRMPYYGGGLTLRYRRAEVAFRYLDGTGVQSRHWVRFEDGTPAIPYSPDYEYWSVRGEYFIRSWFGVGISYRRSTISLGWRQPFQVNGYTVDRGLFSGGTDLRMYDAYVPLRLEWYGIRISGRLGTSVFGRDGERWVAKHKGKVISEGTTNGYNFDFSQFQSPSDPREPTNDQEHVAKGTEGPDFAIAQFVGVEVEIPIWVGVLRTGAKVERLYVRDLTKTWSYDVQMGVGLPF